MVFVLGLFDTAHDIATRPVPISPSRASAAQSPVRALLGSRLNLSFPLFATSVLRGTGSVSCLRVTMITFVRTDILDY